MHRSSILLAAVLLLATACRTAATSDDASGGAPTLGQLIMHWSGGQESARCSLAGPGGELAFGDPQACEWAPVPGSGAVGRVSGSLDSSGRPTMITWERPTEGAADADRLIDSLGAAFVGYGLTARECGDGPAPAGQIRSMVWEGAALVVHLSRIVPDSGAPRLVIMSIDRPDAFPEIACPGATTA